MNRLGITARDIIECCNNISLNAVGLKLSPTVLSDIPLPAILHWHQNHFVVLYKIDNKKNTYYIADPAEGKRKYSESEFLSAWLCNNTGVVILVEPNEKFYKQHFEKESNVKNFLQYLSKYFKLHRKNFILSIVIALLIMLADIYVPTLLRKTIDDGIGQRNIGLIIMLLVCQFAIMAGGLVSSAIMQLLLTKTGLGMHLHMVNGFLEKLAKFPMSFFDRKVSYDFIQKIDDHSRIKDFLLSLPTSVITMVITLIVFSAMLYYYSPLIFGIFIFISICELGWSTIFLNKRKSIESAFFATSAENRNHAFELTNGMADLKVNNAENIRLNKWKVTQCLMNEISMRSTRLNLVQGGGSSVIRGIKDLSVTGLCASMVISGDLTFGIMITIGYITGRLAFPFSNMSNTINTLQSALLSYQRIEDVVEDEEEAIPGKLYSNSSISFNNVWFKYPGTSSPFIIKDLSLKIKSGSVTALVGDSGCGKSTLLKLILGFYLPQKGTVYFGNSEINEIDRTDWLRHCGVVLQEPRIFAGTILENISLSEESPNHDKAIDIFKTVGLYDFIQTLPMGINTLLGPAGMELSGGQKQRMMIARALYKNPDVLIMDEATSSLDANNERTIVENIHKFGKGKTIIVAAHRLSTVQYADNIVYIRDGKITEQGTHDQLLELKGDYWHLVHNQLQLSHLI